MRLRIGISTCPNDTFAFHGLLTGTIKISGIELDFELMDIEQLNRAVLQGGLELAKASFHLAHFVEDRYLILNAGAALGFGVGPLLLASEPGKIPQAGTRSADVTLCPGEYTTAHFLYRHFYPEATRVEQVTFSEIMPRLQNRLADFGVCIHEGRFTWQSQQLVLVEDLGERWEKSTGLPLPLGGILADRRLTSGQIEALEDGIRRSIFYARRHPNQALKTMSQFAQEFDEQVLMKHVELYVNDWTLDLGEVGHAALAEMKRHHPISQLS